MEKIFLFVFFVLFSFCAETKPEKNENLVFKSSTIYPSDVVVIKDSCPSTSLFRSPEVEYLVSKDYIGTRYLHGSDTIVEEAVLGFPPKVMREIHSYGKEIIPYLINKIDIERYVNPGFLNPYESNLQDAVLIGPLGINYAYMIELIMAKDSIRDDVVFSLGGYSSWYDKMKPYQIYGQCVIIRKKDQDKPRKSVITIEEMKQVKSIYEKWWKGNKHDPLESIRKKWRENGSPLRESPFTWI